MKLLLLLPLWLATLGLASPIPNGQKPARWIPKKALNWWAGPGGEWFRKQSDGWTLWDHRKCMKRKYAELDQAHGVDPSVPQLAGFETISPTPQTLGQWLKICGSRASADADEKSPWIGEAMGRGGQRIPTPAAVDPQTGRLRQQDPNQGRPDDGLNNIKQQFADDIEGLLFQENPYGGARTNPAAKPFIPRRLGH